MTGAADSSPGALLQRAGQFLQGGQFAEAAQLCNSVLSAAPGNVDALHLLAIAAQRQGDGEQAEALFNRALGKAPKRADINLSYGSFLRAQGRLAQAELRLRKAVKLAPDVAAAWHALGLLLFARGELPEAVRCARRMTSRAAANPAGWELLAAIEQKRGDLTAAIAACRKGLENAPRAARLHYSLAQLLREACDFAEAAAAYDEALRNGYAAADLYRNCAEALLEAGETDAALARVTAGVAKFPGDATLQRTLARMHFEVAAPGDPVQQLWAAARSQRANADLWQTLVELLQRLGRDDESGLALAEANELGCAAAPGIRLLAAEAAAHSGEEVLASASFERLLQDYPDYTHAQLTYAAQLLRSGDPARADALCAQVLARDPHDQLALAYRGTAWQLLGDARESWLLDYQRMVTPVPVPVPEGYQDATAFFADVQQALETLHRTRAHPLEQSVRGGTQTNGYLFRLQHPILRVLEQQIRAAIVTALHSFPDDPGHPFWGRRAALPQGDGLRFAGAWSVRLRDQGFHTNHIHTQGWISSALYIALPEEVRASNDGQGDIQFGVPMAELGLDLAPRRTIKPEVGTLVLFPSYMWHGTVPFSSQASRITVAFDLLPQA